MKSFLKLLTVSSIVLTLAACGTGNAPTTMDQSNSQSEAMNNDDTSADTADQSSTGETMLAEIYKSTSVGKISSNGLEAKDRVFFNFDQYDVDDDATIVLEKQAEVLASNPKLTASIQGHTDERGTREYNLALGAKRANAVKNKLIDLGVDASRITIKSYGKDKPENTSSNESAWAENRRAVTIVMEEY